MLIFCFDPSFGVVKTKQIRKYRGDAKGVLFGKKNIPAAF